MNQGFDDEIDLLALIKAVLGTWKVWLIAAVLVSIVFGGYQINGYLSRGAKAPYTKIIALTFTGADRGQYPNGAPYRVQDIIAPAVLESIYQELNIAESGLSSVGFQSRISIEPYTPYYREIMAKYDALLSEMDSRKKDFDQIQAIQERKRAELNQALSRSVMISFKPAGTKLSDETIREVVNKIPAEWARRAVIDKGVMKSDIGLVSSKTLADSLFESADYLILGDLFAEKVRTLRENVNKVKSLAGSATVRDPETGWTLSDLETNLHDLETYKIDELMSPIRSLGLSRTPNLAAYYFDEKRKTMQVKLTQLEEESALIQAAYESYKPDPVLAGNGESLSVGGSMLTYPGMAPQVGSDVLDKLIKVAGEDSVEKYRQVLNTRWLSANMKVAELKGDIRNIERVIAAVLANEADSVDAAIRDEYLRRAKTSIPDILSSLRTFYDVNWRIYEQINRERIGSVGYLYKDGHQGVLRASAMPNLKRTVLIYIALMAAMTFVVVPTVMIRNAMKARNQAEATPAAE